MSALRFILIDEYRRDKCIAAIRALNIAKPFVVDVAAYVPKRSNAQNRLYWSWINLIARDYGWRAEELHEVFKQKFIGYVDAEVFNEKVSIVKSTTRLSTKEFTEYLEKIEQFANEKLGIQLPHPDDYRLAMQGDRS